MKFFLNFIARCAGVCCDSLVLFLVIIIILECEFCRSEKGGSVTESGHKVELISL